MANLKITELDELATKSALDENDLVEIVDVSDTSMAPTGTNKRAPLQAVIGELLAAVPGTIVPSAALVADAAGAIEGVDASILGRLVETPGTWASNKVLCVDATGLVAGVSSAQFAVLNVTPGDWTAEKALVPDGSGQLAGVSQTQFQALDVTAGAATAEKAVVLDADGRVTSTAADVRLLADPTISLFVGDYTGLFDETQICFLDSATASSGQLTATACTFTVGAYTTEYAATGLEINTSAGTAIFNTGRLELSSGAEHLYVTLGETIAFELSSTDLTVVLEGLPTSEPALSYRVWVDPDGYLRLKLP